MGLGLEVDFGFVDHVDSVLDAEFGTIFTVVSEVADEGLQVSADSERLRLSWR